MSHAFFVYVNSPNATFYPVFITRNGSLKTIFFLNSARHFYYAVSHTTITTVCDSIATFLRKRECRFSLCRIREDLANVYLRLVEQNENALRVGR